MAAKCRWKILSKAIKEKIVVEDSNSTKRTFQSYNILHSKMLQQDEVGTWYSVAVPQNYRHNVNDETLSDNSVTNNASDDKSDTERDILIRLQSSKVSITQLTGFNNTGNVCIWPSEECLALYLVKNNHTVPRSGHVLELGGGQTCLAGLMFAAACCSSDDDTTVWLTDGNDTSVQNLKAICAKNPDLKVKSGIYRWTEDLNPDIACNQQFDLILCADCLFFQDGRQQLVNKIHVLMKNGGKAMIMAPERAGTFTKFRHLAEDLFNIEIIENFDEEVLKKHTELLNDPTYQPDIHLPKLMILTKK